MIHTVYNVHFVALSDLLDVKTKKYLILNQNVICCCLSGAWIAVFIADALLLMWASASFFFSLLQGRSTIHWLSFIHSNLYLSLENQRGFPHVQWCWDTEKHWVKQIKKAKTRWKQLHTEVKWFEVVSVLVVTTQARRMDCVRQSKVLGMLMRPPHMQAELSLSWPWPFPPLTAWNLTPCLWWGSTVSCESKQKELVCATRGQHVNKDRSLVRGPFSNMETIKRKAFWCFIYFIFL